MNEVQKVLLDPKYRQYLRMNPSWYLTLNHEPDKVNLFKQTFKKEHQETFSDKLDKLCFILEMIKMVI